MFDLSNLADNIPESIIIGNRNTVWNGLSIDSRTIKTGELFIAIKGENFDGHNYIREAYHKGAAAVV